jgi:hypothetical protein
MTVVNGNTNHGNKTDVSPECIGKFAMISLAELLLGIVETRKLRR